MEHKQVLLHTDSDTVIVISIVRHTGLVFDVVTMNQTNS